MKLTPQMYLNNKVSNGSLAGVLTALGMDYMYCNDSIRFIMDDNDERHICIRQLLNEDGTDCTLRQQSEETQEYIAKLLGRKE